jgi:hypothetical protein
MELTGRFSMLGATAQAEPGDLGYPDSGADTLTADQQSLRLMLEHSDGASEWAAHLRSVRLHNEGLAAPASHSSALFRYTELGDELVSQSSDTSATTVYYELDRLFYRYQLEDYTISLGRQAIDWGSGRFWQPLNVFGSFAPTDLDTDYKPGIDALVVDYFPSPFSSLTAVYALAPEDQPEDQDEIKDSAALHYRRQVGELSELTLLAGSITGNSVAGAAFESAWRGIGWHIEGLHYDLRESDEQSLFWVIGMEYQFNDGTLLTAEYYDNSRGATTESMLPDMFSDDLVVAGLQQQLSRRLIGIGLSRDITPLLSGSYTLLAAVLDEPGGRAAWSHLHQLNLTYSVSNESDLLFSLLLPQGKGGSEIDDPQSEFGHLPATLSLRLRFYF